MINKALCLDPADNVGVALTDLKPGDSYALNGAKGQIISEVSSKHKFALEDLSVGEDILMYGTIVGETTQEIKAGEAVTLANIKHKIRDFKESGATYEWSSLDVKRWSDKTFMGYERADGQVGTANYWLVMPMVFCENTNVKLLQDAFEKALGFAVDNPYENQVRNLVAAYQQEKFTESVSAPLQDTNSKVFENIDGVRFLTHEGGCGGTRRDSDTLCALLAGYINHPNVAGATILSLGCQNAQVSILKESLSKIQKGASKPVIVCDQQEEGTTKVLLEKAVKETFAGLVEANKIPRTPAPLSKLVIGLECGGSDGFSGISANPTLGQVSDMVISLGGAAILSEFPELCGAEQTLIDRCKTPEISDKFIRLMDEYARAAENVGSGFDMNPSPGNIKDGLLTDAIKSCGAAKKGGTAPVSDVLDYTEYIKEKGLNLLCTPGNDVESTTGLAGSGANVILFSTGLGTPTGNPVCPVIKVSTNDKLAARMPDIIDFNTGGIISGEETIESAGDKLLELIVDVASGRVKTKAEQKKNYDFIPWKRGVSL
ncbi:UxaA family hydrolase [Algoriphagus machipongonensis]|uniref:Hydrolase, UxaA family n=1 Tax=Algoriphagus machipongonensis TaxID=388413 RepID=A3HSR1_9BACT|nr:altronate dehydratase family protein [Algoriphagus machipongonensis]EAZ82879.1 hydrolase, UxaA family [Algoriphagus machipongonensis]